VKQTVLLESWSLSKFVKKSFWTYDRAVLPHFAQSQFAQSHFLTLTLSLSLTLSLTLTLTLDWANWDWAKWEDTDQARIANHNFGGQGILW